MTSNGTLDPDQLRAEAQAFAKRRDKHRKEREAIRARARELCTQMYAAGIPITQQAKIIGVDRQYVDRWWVDKEAARELAENPSA